MPTNDPPRGSRPLSFSSADGVQVGKLTGLAAVGFVAAYGVAYWWRNVSGEELTTEQMGVLSTAIVFTLSTAFQYFAKTDA